MNPNQPVPVIVERRKIEASRLRLVKLPAKRPVAADRVAPVQLRRAA